jgi:hypothetical protein
VNTCCSAEGQLLFCAVLNNVVSTTEACGVVVQSAKLRASSNTETSPAEAPEVATKLQPMNKGGAVMASSKKAKTGQPPSKRTRGNSAHSDRAEGGEEGLAKKSRKGGQATEVTEPIKRGKGVAGKRGLRLAAGALGDKVEACGGKAVRKKKCSVAAKAAELPAVDDAVDEAPGRVDLGSTAPSQGKAASGLDTGATENAAALKEKPVKRGSNGSKHLARAVLPTAAAKGQAAPSAAPHKHIMANQGPGVAIDTHPSALDYCRTWCEFLNNHWFVSTFMGG